MTLILPSVFLIALIFTLKKTAALCDRKDIYAQQKKRSILLRSFLSSYRLITTTIFFVYLKYIYMSITKSEPKYSVLNFVFNEAYFIVLLFLLNAIVLLTVFDFKKRIIKKLTLEERITSDLNNNSKRTKIDALAKVISGLWMIFVVIFLLEHFGVPISSILAFGGMGSIVIGFAAKDLLGDFISGFLIYIDGGFDLGEWIKLEEPKLEGTVEYIGWRVSRIRTFDDRPLYVPNGLLSKAIVQNVSRRESMRIKEYITVSIESANIMAIICKEIRNDILSNHDGIDQDRSVVVNLTSYQAGVCWIYISAFTRSGDMNGFYGIKQDILIKIHAVLQANDVFIESPKVSIHQMNSTS